MSHSRMAPLGALLVALMLPACGPGACGGDGPGMNNGMALAESWLRVSALDRVTIGSGTARVSMRVAPVYVSRTVGAEREEAIAIHGSFLPGIHDALTVGADVYLAMASKGLEERQVAYVIVRGADGSHHFPGECENRQEDGLRTALGDRYDATLDAVVGVGGQRILTILERAEDRST